MLVAARTERKGQGGILRKQDEETLQALKGSQLLAHTPLPSPTGMSTVVPFTERIQKEEQV